MQYQYSDTLGGNPAQADHSTGIIYLNRLLWPSYPPLYQKYFLEHEKGHIIQKSADQITADTYAFKAIASSQPEQAMLLPAILEKTLDFTSQRDRERIANMHQLTDQLKQRVKTGFKPVSIKTVQTGFKPVS